LLTPFAACLDAGCAPRAINAESDMEVRRRQIGCRPLRPFDQTDAITSEVFLKTRIQVFFWLVESIKIKVIQV
jgi:hypothetical protein